VVPTAHPRVPRTRRSASKAFPENRYLVDKRINFEQTPRHQNARKEDAAWASELPRIYMFVLGGPSRKEKLDSELGGWVGFAAQANLEKLDSELGSWVGFAAWAQLAELDITRLWSRVSPPQSAH
jgi:hypothetical protein